MGHDTLIYRYLPFQRFLDMLFKKELTLVSPSKWPDQYESYWLKALETDYGRTALAQYIKKFEGDDENKARKIIGLCAATYSSAYCLCFSSEMDSEVLWNAHSDGNRGIMISINKEKLLELVKNDNASMKEVKYDLEQAEIGESFLPKYRIYPEGTVENDPDDLFLHKRNCFSYEKEIRLITSSYENGKEKYLRRPIPNLPELIEGVMVHPLAKDNYVSLVEKICTHFGLKFLGKSKVYEFSTVFS